MIARLITSGYGGPLHIERLSRRSRGLCGARAPYGQDGTNRDCRVCNQLYAHIIAYQEVYPVEQQIALPMAIHQLPEAARRAGRAFKQFTQTIERRVARPWRMPQ